MRVNRSCWILLVLLSGCSMAATRTGPDVQALHGLHVEGFVSDAPTMCRASDAALNDAQALAFFRAARQVSYQQIHDDYDVAPCFIRGSVRMGQAMCSFTIRPGGVASLTCGANSWHHVCEHCAGL